MAPPLVTTESFRPFEFHASQAALDDLKRRVEATRWPEKELVNDQTQGVPLATLKALAKYWATEYDWRKVQARLNPYPGEKIPIWLMAPTPGSSSPTGLNETI